MGVYFDASGNLTTNKPTSREDWEAHFRYRREAEKDPVQREAMIEQTRSIMAQNQQDEMAEKLRKTYVRAGGDPKEWAKAKAAILATYLEGAAVDGITNKKTSRDKQIRL